MDSPDGTGWSLGPAWHSHPAALRSYCGSSSSLITARTLRHSHTNTSSSMCHLIEHLGGLPIGKYVQHAGQPGELTMSHLCSPAKPIRFDSVCRGSAVAAASRVASGGWWQRIPTVQVSLFSHPHTYRQEGRCFSSYYSRVRFCRCQWFQSETDGTVHIMSATICSFWKNTWISCDLFICRQGAPNSVRFLPYLFTNIHKHIIDAFIPLWQNPVSHSSKYHYIFKKNNIAKFINIH